MISATFVSLGRFYAFRISVISIFVFMRYSNILIRYLKFCNDKVTVGVAFVSLEGSCSFLISIILE